MEAAPTLRHESVDPIAKRAGLTAFLRLVERAILPLTIVGLFGGLILWWAGNAHAAGIVWAIPSLIVAVRLAWSIARDIAAGSLGVDIIAILAIGGALLLGEYLAAAVIAVMLATGEALERYAQGRAHRELSALLGRAPRDVQRYVDGRLETVPIDVVEAGDRLAIRPGEVVSVDGMAVGGPAVLDELALTGESRLVTRSEGEAVLSGTVNAGSSFDLRATAPAAASTYAGIVRLVQEAQESKAPFVRLADRYALLFIPVTIWRSRALPGSSRGTRSAASRCWSSRRRARSCWPPRSPSWPGYREPPDAVSSSRAGDRSRRSPEPGSSSSTRPGR